jgi:hypothetical protein
MAVFMYAFLWLRATFPRYRYDQIMRLGWKVLIPVTIVWLMVLGLFIVMDWPLINLGYVVLIGGAALIVLAKLTAPKIRVTAGEPS